MKTLSMSGLEPNFGEEDSLLKELRAKKAKENEFYKKKVELSFDEEKVGKGVAEFFSAQLPEGTKINKAKNPTDFTAVNAAFDEDDPRKQLMPVVRQNYRTLLRNKDFKGVGENELLNLAYQTTIKGTPSSELEGATYEDDIHRYKYKEDTARFGMGKEVAAAPGYEEWLAREKARPMEDRQIGFGEAALFNLGFMAAGRALKKPVSNAIGRALLKTGAEKAGQWLMRVAPPQGKLVGAALTAAALAIPETIGWNAVAKSDWYRAREDEPIKRELAALTISGLSGAAAYRTAGKQVLGAMKRGAEKGVVTEAMLKNFVADSTAENIMKVGAARRAEKKALDKISDVFNKAGASGEERKAWFERLAESENDFTRTGFFGRSKYTDEDALKGVIRGKVSDAENFMFGRRALPAGDTLPGEELYSGTRAVANVTPQVLFKRNMGSDFIESVPLGGQRNLELPSAELLALPGQAALRGTSQVAIPGGQLALPRGTGPGFFGLRNAPINPPIEPSGGAGGGGIFGLSQRKLAAPFEEIERSFGWTGEAAEQTVKRSKDASPIFGIPKKKLEKSFTKLDTDDAAFVIDEVTNRGKTLEESLIGMERSKMLRSAVKTSEENIAKAKTKTTTLPPDQAIKYEGTQAAADSGKAAKVLELTKEVNAAKAELTARKAAEQAAIRSAAAEARTLSDIVESPIAKDLLPERVQGLAEGGNILDGPLTDKEFEKRASGILEYFGAKFRTEGTAVPPMSADRVARADASLRGTARPKVKKSEMAAIDPEFEQPEFLKTFKGEMTQSDFIWKIAEDPGFGELEAKRIFNLAQKRGISYKDLPNTKLFREFKSVQEKANFVRGEVLDPVVDDISEFAGESLVVDKAGLKSIIPLTAVGTVSVAAVLGLPEDSHASVASVIGEAAARGIKALPKAWINTVKDLQDVSKLGHDAVQKKFAQLIKESEAAGYISRQVGKSKTLPARMKVPDFTALAKELYGSTVAAVKTTKQLPFGFERIMSPWARGALHYKTGANPAVHIAAMQTAWTENIKNAYAVFDNIMRDVSGGKSSAREVAKMFAPLADQYSGVVQTYQIVSTKIKQLEKAIPVMEKVLKNEKLDSVMRANYIKRMENAKKQLNAFTTHMREDIAPLHAEFMKKHEELTKQAANKFASTRVFLAANDTEAMEYYPWLKGILRKEEREAAIHVKAMMKSYEESAVESGLNVITDRPYMHYSWHPSWKANAAEDFATKIGLDLPITTVPNNQFHSRMVGAVPMLPDVHHSVQSYIPMAEKILGWRAFWNKNGPKDASWYKHMMSSTVQHNSALRGFWNAVKDASIPAEQMMVDKWMDRYTSFEVLRLLGGSPSVAYKHFFKNIGTWGSLGFKEAMSHMGTAVTTAARNKITSPEGVKYLAKIGIDANKLGKKFYDDAAKSYTSQMKRLSVLDDIDLRPASQLTWFDNFLNEVNHKAGFMVNAVESYDRVHSFLAAGEMAAKRGLTARDASYAIYDTILKNNFLGGALNPSWAKSPSVRAIMLFQTTAFKIFERRLVTLHQSGRAISEAWKEAAKMNWTWDKAFSEIKTLKDFIRKGEYEFKKGIITDALAGERDFLGQFAVRQQMREMLYAGVVLGGGAMLGHDYAHHISHLPFVQKSFEGEPVIGFSPIARAIWDTKEGKVYAGEESEFGMVGDFLNNWFRSQGPIPQMVNKAINVSRDDIPEIYREEGFLPKEFRYFWAIPSTKEKE
jgi:hypothetical protein